MPTTNFVLVNHVGATDRLFRLLESGCRDLPTFAQRLFTFSFAIQLFRVPAFRLFARETPRPVATPVVVVNLLSATDPATAYNNADELAIQNTSMTQRK
jgi:hypothetical protein